MARLSCCHDVVSRLMLIRPSDHPEMTRNAKLQWGKALFYSSHRSILHLKHILSQVRAARWSTLHQEVVILSLFIVHSKEKWGGRAL